jgi:hypothetical protein
VLTLTVGIACLADPPKNYYDTATDKTGRALTQKQTEFMTELGLYN